MAIKLDIKNVERLVTKLQIRMSKAKRDSEGSVVVGYTADYSVYVHENLMAYHKPPTKAKYLEGPLRLLTPMLSEIINSAVRSGKGLLQGLYNAGLLLQRESQKVVPVDTGYLRSTAFTRLDRSKPE